MRVHTYLGRCGVAAAVVALGASLILPARVDAGMAVQQWYFGSWDCSIDGRPARMRWRVVDDPQMECDGDNCSLAQNVAVVGQFSDNGGPWVTLRKRGATQTSLSIRYMGNEKDNWYLKYDAQARKASGYTTWRGNRYPLFCWHRGR